MPARARLLRMSDRPSHADGSKDRVSSVFAFADVRPPSSAARAAAATAYREGFDAGLTEGFAQCEQQAVTYVDSRRAVHEQLLQRIEAATAAYRSWAIEDDERSARLLADAALQLAESVVGRALGRTYENGTQPLDAATQTVRRLTASAGPNTVVTARMHPDDAALIDSATFGCSLSVVPDVSLERGDCVVDLGDRRIDARVGAALARARAEMFGEDSIAGVVR